MNERTVGFFELGQDKFKRSVRDHQNLYDVAQELSTRINTPPGLSIFNGYMNGCIHLLSKAKRQGVRFTGAIASLVNDDVDLMTIDYFTTLHEKNVSDKLYLMLNAAEQVRSISKIKFPALQREIAPVKAPIEVTVVSMPTRKTMTVIERDADDNMVGAHQIESDS